MLDLPFGKVSKKVPKHYARARVPKVSMVFELRFGATYEQNCPIHVVYIGCLAITIVMVQGYFLTCFFFSYSILHVSVARHGAGPRAAALHRPLRVARPVAPAPRGLPRLRLFL